MAKDVSFVSNCFSLIHGGRVIIGLVKFRSTMAVARVKRGDLLGCLIDHDEKLLKMCR